MFKIIRYNIIIDLGNAISDYTCIRLVIILLLIAERKNVKFNNGIEFY